MRLCVSADVSVVLLSLQSGSSHLCPTTHTPVDPTDGRTTCHPAARVGLCARDRARPVDPLAARPRRLAPPAAEEHSVRLCLWPMSKGNATHSLIWSLSHTLLAAMHARVPRSLCCSADALDSNASLAALRTQFGVPSSSLRVYVHYQPTYYHFHVHFSHVKLTNGAFGVCVLCGCVRVLARSCAVYLRSACVYEASRVHAHVYVRVSLVSSELMLTLAMTRALARGCCVNDDAYSQARRLAKPCCSKTSSAT